MINGYYSLLNRISLLPTNIHKPIESYHETKQVSGTATDGGDVIAFARDFGKEEERE